MSSNSVAIEFRGAGFSYAAAKGAASAHGVSFAQREGECVVVTGPSGCGKTTLARMVNGLIPAVYAGTTEGGVYVFGRAVADWEMDDLSCAVGSVFQNPRSQFFNLDTTSEIAFGCENMGVPRDEIARRIASATRALGVEHLLERDIRALSGGEKQLVAVASVHAMEPSAFVLDEPTAALDVRAMMRLREAVSRLKATGKTVIVAEHRLWWLRGVADRVVLMRDGTIVEEMTSEEFTLMPAEERRRLGLRAWDIRQVEPCATGAACEGSGDSARRVPALVVRGLEARYGRRGRLVVDGCDFDAEAGRAVALVGRNGAGKTTFARCLAGLHAETAGEILIEGEALDPRKRAGRVFLGMQESGYQLFSDTVEGELRLALQARRVREAPDTKEGAAEGSLESESALIEAARSAPALPLGRTASAARHCRRVAAGVARTRARRADERSRPREHGAHRCRDRPAQGGRALHRRHHARLRVRVRHVRGDRSFRKRPHRGALRPHSVDRAPRPSPVRVRLTAQRGRSSSRSGRRFPLRRPHRYQLPHERRRFTW